MTRRSRQVINISLWYRPVIFICMPLHYRYITKKRKTEFSYKRPNGIIPWVKRSWWSKELCGRASDNWNSSKTNAVGRTSRLQVEDQWTDWVFVLEVAVILTDELTAFKMMKVNLREEQCINIIEIWTVRRWTPAIQSILPGLSGRNPLHSNKKVDLKHLTNWCTTTAASA